MQPTWLPAVPAFADASESVVWGALKRHVRPSAIIAPISSGFGFHPRARIWAERASMRSQKPGGNWPWSSLESMGGVYQPRGHG